MLYYPDNGPTSPGPLGLSHNVRLLIYSYIESSPALFIGLTTSQIHPAGGGGGILKICLKNWQINVSDLTTADGQKIIGGGKYLGRGGKDPLGAAKKVASKFANFRTGT